MIKDLGHARVCVYVFVLLIVGLGEGNLEDRVKWNACQSWPPGNQSYWLVHAALSHFWSHPVSSIHQCDMKLLELHLKGIG